MNDDITLSVFGNYNMYGTVDKASILKNGGGLIDISHIT